MSDTPVIPVINTDNNALNNAPAEISVGELSRKLQKSIEEQFSYVRIKGEISGFKRHSSGHCYFALKDNDAVIDAVIWKGNAVKLSFAPQDGLEVIATGKVTTFMGRSKYQIILDDMKPAGAGALMALLEQLKQKLAVEGLFKAEHKKPLPFLPKIIGVITSPTGAVIRDILHRLQERTFPHIYVFPVAVQGELSARQISYAVNFFNRCTDDTPVKRPDVIIIARGGGSVEDLWSFNEEIVVRAVAGSHIPIISAVGHETDTTLCDYAADKRAPTPTAAAEMAVPVKQDLIYTLSQMNHRLNRAFDKYMSDKTQNLNHLIRTLPKPETLFNMLQQKIDFCAEHLTSALRHIVVQKKSDFQSFASVMRVQLIINLHHHHKNKLKIYEGGLNKSMFNIINIHKMKAQQNSQYVDILGERLNKAVNNYFKNHHHYINMHHKSLNNLSYKNVLSRGYAVIHGDSGIISSYHQTKTTLPERIEFHDGVLKLK